MRQSPNFDGKAFVNPIPTKVGGEGNMGKMLAKLFKSHPNRKPATTPGPFPVDFDKLYELPANTLRVTWLGHSGLIIEIDGKRFLTDPVYRRASPLQIMGPKRFFPAPISLNDLPHLDAIIISHDHYDHLDKTIIVALATQGTPIFTSLGVGDILTKWGVPHAQITEMDWWESINIGDGFTLSAAPARHFSGRSIRNRNQTLWASYAIKGPVHNVYYGADSGIHPLFKEIGERLGPFDIAMLEVGASDPLWADIHMGPANATDAMLALGAKVMMPIHWGTFNLAFHAWTQPADDTIKYAAEKGIKLIMPAPGEIYTYDGKPYINKWWEKFM